MAIHSNIVQCQFNRFHMCQPVAIQRNADQTPSAENKMEFSLAFAREVISVIHCLDVDQNVLSIQIVHWIDRAKDKNALIRANMLAAAELCAKL